ncbi:MAG TPA: anti-sigma factor [Acidimicrobiia bacterium]|nr:anti-sigma factor [Acidimicrobiia bacterium]
MTIDDFERWTGAYVLDALDDTDRARFEEYLATHPEAAREVEELRAAAARLGAASATTPPPGLRARVLAEASRTRQDTVATPTAPDIAMPDAPDELSLRRRRRLLVARSVAAVAAAIVLVTGGVLVFDSQRRADDAEQLVAVLSDPSAVVVDLDGTEGDLRVVWSEPRREAVLVGSDLAIPAAGRTYELWVVRDGRPQASVLFRPDAGGEVERLFGVDLAGADGLAVTEEPAGGSIEPSGAILREGAI